MLYIDHMKLENLMTFDEHFAKMMKDPKFRDEYKKLEPNYVLGDSVIEKRLKKKMTPAALAKKIGTKEYIVARLEVGDGNFSMNFLKKVAKALSGTLKVTI